MRAQGAPEVGGITIKLDVRRPQSAYVGGCKLEGCGDAMRCAKVTACAGAERRQKQEHPCKSRRVLFGQMLPTYMHMNTTIIMKDHLLLQSLGALTGAIIISLLNASRSKVCVTWAILTKESAIPCTVTTTTVRTSGSSLYLFHRMAAIRMHMCTVDNANPFS